MYKEGRLDKKKQKKKHGEPCLVGIQKATCSEQGESKITCLIKLSFVKLGAEHPFRVKQLFRYFPKESFKINFSM